MTVYNLSTCRLSNNKMKTQFNKNIYFYLISTSDVTNSKLEIFKPNY